MASVNSADTKTNDVFTRTGNTNPAPTPDSSGDAKVIPIRNQSGSASTRDVIEKRPAAAANQPAAQPGAPKEESHKVRDAIFFLPGLLWFAVSKTPKLLFKHIIPWVWNHSVRPAWKYVAKPLITKVLWPAMKWTWKNLLKRPVEWTVDNVVVPFFRHVVKPAVKFGFNKIVKPLWNNVVTPLYKNVAKPILRTAWKYAIKPAGRWLVYEPLKFVFYTGPRFIYNNIPPVRWAVNGAVSAAAAIGRGIAGAYRTVSRMFGG